MRKSTRQLLIAFVILVAAVVLLVGIGVIPTKNMAFLKSKNDPIYIAVVAPWDNGESYNKEMELSIKLLLDKVNKEGGINGHPIEIIPYDESTSEAAKASANAIAIDDKSLIAIGFTSSDQALDARDIYKENSVPAITISASNPDITKKSEWFFSLINSNETMGRYAAGYVTQVLGSKKATVIYQRNDPYGESLKDAFVNWFTRLGGVVVLQAPLNYGDEPSKRASDSLAILSDVSRLEDGDPGVIFLALNSGPAHDFVMTMRDQGKKYVVIGSEDTSGDGFAEGFSELPKEIAQKGFYTDGMYALPPIIFDVIGKKGQDFHSEYEKSRTYQSQKFDLTEAPELTWFGGLSYDTVLMAVEAMKKADLGGDPASLKSDREKIKNALTGFNSYGNGVDGVSGRIYFNQDRVFERPVAVGIFQNQRFISAPLQIQPVPDNLNIAGLGDQIIQIGAERLFKTRVVYVGMDINNIASVDIDRARQYSLDFYIWFRYQGNADVEEIEFPDAVSDISLSSPISESNISNEFGNTHYRAYRVTATFNGDFNLKNYPFDQQSLVVRFRHKNLQRTQMIYVVDYLGMGDFSSSAIYNGLTDENGNFPSVSEWKPADQASFFIDTVEDNSTLGNPQLFNVKENKIEYSQFNASVDVKRDVIQFVMKSMFPVLFIITLTYLGLFLPKDEIGTIAGSITGSVLSIVLFHVDLSGRLNVGYSVALDNAFYAIYALLAVELLLSIVAWHKKNDETLVRRLLNTARIIYPLIVVGGGFLMLWSYGVI